jgi:hypothetical protein
MLPHALRCLPSTAAGAVLSFFATIALAARTQMQVQKELEVLELYELLFV